MNPKDSNELRGNKKLKIPNALPPNKTNSASGAVRESIDQSAFAYDSDNERLNIEKGILSVSCLLTLLSQIGNKDVDGMTAYGLALTLNRLANYSHQLYDEGEFQAGGGEPWYLLKAIQTKK